MKINKFINLLSKNQNTQFVSLIGYKTARGDRNNYNVVINCEYESLVAKSIVQMMKFVPTTEEQTQAKKEILESLQASIISTDSKLYPVTTDDGKTVKSLRKNKNDDIYLVGMLVNKASKEDKVAPKNEKDRLFKTLPVSKIRQFKLTDDIENISINKKHVKID
jgi:hypothetical protein